MKDPERYKGLFIFVFTTTAMTAIGFFLNWCRDNRRWDLFAVYAAAILYFMWRYWDDRDDLS